ncbi:MAG: hypothetical protein NC314_09470 [Roseburia sp.]|nr:hypothetical protein [Roseburia sp.]MCM1243057.1 hypothetical protein [Roseburia sp.]
MKKRIIMLAGVMTAAVMGAVSSVYPAYASGALRSRGAIALEGGEVALEATDIEYLYAETEALAAALPDTGNEMSYDIIKDTIRRNQIKSHGIIDYGGGKVVLDASDLKYLADEIDTLESSYKVLTAQALNGIGTFFLPDASVTYDPDKATALQEYAGALTFDKLYEGILQSQSVAHLEGIQAAESRNLSAGTAAWVNGTLLIGSGEDNQASYDEGYAAGSKDAIKHIYGGESVMVKYPDVCTDLYFGSSSPLWTSLSDSKAETYQIPLQDEEGRVLYGLSFQCAYRARQHLSNEVAACGGYTLSTKEGTVIEASGQITAPAYHIEDLSFISRNVYIDLFSTSFLTEDGFLYLSLWGNTFARYISYNEYAQAYADFQFVDIVAKYK